MTLSRLFVAPVIAFAVVSPFGAATASAATPTQHAHYSSPAQAGQGDATQTFVSKINALRASVGAGPLTVDNTLTANAAGWARTMGSQSRMYHQVLALSPGFTSRAENIAYGQSVDAIHQALTRSPGHYENMTNPAYNKVGVGVAVGSDGNLYVAEEFGRA